VSSVVSEATYLITSSILDIIDKYRRRRRRRKVFRRARELEARAKRPPPGYVGYVRVGDRAKIIGRHTRIVVDVPFYGQTEYEHGGVGRAYVTAAEVVSPEWFNVVKVLYSRLKAARRGGSRGEGG